MNRPSLNTLFFSLGLGLFSLASLAQTVTPVTDFRSGPGNGIYSYVSSSPATVMELMNANRPRPAATAQGQLVLPANAPADAKLPAVVLVHGSGGIYPEQLSYWAKLFNEQGIAVMVIDVFAPRGVQTTGEDQSQVPYASDTADTYAAMGMLATHPRIDPKRIAVMGVSRGGVAAVRSAVTPIANGSAPAGLRFAAHIAMYTSGCAGTLAVSPKPGVFGSAPILFVHGDADDYTYISDCKIYAQRISAAGTKTEFVTLPGARHKFDMDDTRRINLRNNTKTKEGCPLEFDVKEFKYRDRRNEETVSQANVTALSKELCADKGATIEGDRKARDAAGKAVIEFLNRVLKS